MSVDIPQAIAAVEAALAALAAEREAAKAYQDAIGTRQEVHCLSDVNNIHGQVDIVLRNHAPTLLAAIASKDAEIERLRAALVDASDFFTDIEEEHGAQICGENVAEFRKTMRTALEGKQ